MYCSVLSATVSGMEMIPVQVEADVSDGMPQFTMVGYVSAQVKEAQDRVRTALKNMGISLPPKRITINLSPADVRKEGSRFDLPIAAGVLMTLGRIPPRSLRKTMVLGELGLDGHVQEISGVFPAAAKARELGCTTLLVPAGNAAEGGLHAAVHLDPIPRHPFRIECHPCTDARYRQQRRCIRLPADGRPCDSDRVFMKWKHRRKQKNRRNLK